MDFSVKQALAIVIVIVIGALLIGGGLILTKGNNKNSATLANGMWKNAAKVVEGETE